MNDNRQPIVVGLDGSPGSDAAADNAAQTAMRRDRPLRLVHGYLYPMGYGALGYSPYSPALPDPRDDAHAMVEEAAARLRDRYPKLSITTAEVAAGGAPALLDASRHADLVVVGCRGVGGFTELLLGSVSSQVAAHAECPVIVVRPAEPAPPTDTAPPRPDGPVVVGVDGSPGSALAVEFAFAEAAARGVGLTAMHVCWFDKHVRPGESAEQYERRTREQAGDLVSDAVRPWLDKYPQVPVTTEVVLHLNVEYQMVEASRGASLVVVGARGRGGFTGLLLGSVSQALVHHGHCPIAVVHAHRSSR